MPITFAVPSDHPDAFPSPRGDPPLPPSPAKTAKDAIIDLRSRRTRTCSCEYAKSLTALRSSHEAVDCCAGKRLQELMVRSDQVPRSARRAGHRNSSTMVHLLLFWGNGMGTPDPGERERRSKSWRKQWFSGDGIHCSCCE